MFIWPFDIFCQCLCRFLDRFDQLFTDFSGLKIFLGIRSVYCRYFLFMSCLFTLSLLMDQSNFIHPEAPFFSAVCFERRSPSLPALRCCAYSRVPCCLAVPPLLLCRKYTVNLKCIFCIFHKVGVNLFFFHMAYQLSLHHVFKTPPCPTILQGCLCHRSGFHRAVCAASLVCSPVLGLVCCSWVTKSCPTHWYPTQWTEISQARMLERVAISFLRGSSRPRDRTHIPCIGSRIL